VAGLVRLAGLLVALACSPDAAAIGFPAWALDARKVPPGRTITAQTAMTIGSTQSALRPKGDGDIADADEAW